ncbi:hypothetical protein G5I_00674 [Acromyrmex echinatior]|uniref:Uncharacterized protein n=1 Tax=Acromyrmex echinatior TaxID=103372 RepID=F4W5H7_ACREC|nr:hypothetical protein G5I_00674 [Acromyrmex echinatior]
MKTFETGNIIGGSPACRQRVRDRLLLNGIRRVPRNECSVKDATVTVSQKSDNPRESIFEVEPWWNRGVPLTKCEDQSGDPCGPSFLKHFRSATRPRGRGVRQVEDAKCRHRIEVRINSLVQLSLIVTIIDIGNEFHKIIAVLIRNPKLDLILALHSELIKNSFSVLYSGSEVSYQTWRIDSVVNRALN